MTNWKMNPITGRLASQRRMPQSNSLSERIGGVGVTVVVVVGITIVVVVGCVVVVVVVG